MEREKRRDNRHHDCQPGNRKFTPATAGALELTATITNGASSSTNYTKDITITIAKAYKAVAGITGYPETGTTGTEIDLTTATVNPVDANQ